MVNHRNRPYSTLNIITIFFVIITFITLISSVSLSAQTIVSVAEAEQKKDSTSIQNNNENIPNLELSNYVKKHNTTQDEIPNPNNDTNVKNKNEETTIPLHEKDYSQKIQNSKTPTNKTQYNNDNINSRYDQLENNLLINIVSEDLINDKEELKYSDKKNSDKKNPPNEKLPEEKPTLNNKNTINDKKASDKKKTNTVINLTDIKDNIIEQHPNTKGKNLPIPNAQLKVAVLIPLSNKFSKFGKAIQDSLEKATFDYDNPKVNLKFFDTKGNMDVAQQAFKQALEFKPNIIIGPVLASSVHKITPLALQHHIPVIALTNNPEVAQKGIYVMSIGSKIIFKRIMQWISQQNKNKTKQLAILTPDSEYGNSSIKSLRQISAKYGKSIVKIIKYSQTSNANSIAEELAKGKNYSYLFVTGVGKKVRQIVAALSYQRVAENVTIIGTQYWTEDWVTHDNGLNNAIFATTNFQNINKFKQDFIKTFHYQPVDIAVTAYEVFGMILSIAQNIHNNKQANYKNITQQIEKIKGYQGISGVFRLNNTGVLERTLNIYKIYNGKFIIISRQNTL